MRLQDFLVKQTQKSLGDLLRAIDALPEDRLEWSPAPTSRSALSQLKEVALAPRFFIPLIQTGQPPAFDHDAQVEEDRARTAMSDIGEAREAAMKATADLCALIRDFPDERLDDEVTLPFGGGMAATMAEVLGLHFWNIVYHYGQVNYMQTVLGDREMH